ncbi:cytochrome P450 [Pseudanabaena mucicola]|uniref:Cytochrome P450 n=1 Tax=Pseudanabaena mucicola FACHB-723 TaxID=2692860 RepID=A0ABR8A065_9CYAN|nr:cytochrome P450 [Pseudanabaena mucicola]MBD2189621.1 cytochrome P450 [Pseudanabaena mucicola FACHB-723]
MSHLINKINISPFWQQMQWVVDPVGYMGKAVTQYPDIFTAEIIGFGNSLLFVNEPQAIQQILTNDRKQFCAPGELNEILKPVLGGNSVIMIDGERHRKRRQVVMPSFHGARMQNYGQIIFDITNKVFQGLLAQKKENQASVNFLAREAMQEISMQIILQAVFGLYEGKRSEQLRYLMTQMTALFNSPFTSAALFFKVLQKDLGAWSPWGNFIRQKEQLDQLIYQEISERRANHDPERTDILTMLLSAIDEEGNGMSDLELHDELLALLFAGHETTATAMSWALYWVHHLPEVKAKILQELKTLSNPHDWMSIFRLPYLTAVCNETLRIHPVGMLTFPRVAEESVNILGHQIEPKTIVVGCIYLLHQRQDLYPEPSQFKPERFLDRQYSSYEFMPFGGGVRRCVGEALAQFEMKIVLATILANYDVDLCDRKSVKPQRRGVTLAPAGGIRMILR